jgi:hypothetical protein
MLQRVLIEMVEAAQVGMSFRSSSVLVATPGMHSFWLGLRAETFRFSNTTLNAASSCRRETKPLPQ